MFAPVIAAIKGGDAVQAAKLAREAVFQLGPGGFDREPQAVQTRVLDNARDHAADFRRSGTAGHHVRYAEEFPPADACHARGEDASILRANQLSDQQVHPGGTVGCASRYQP